MAVKEEPGPRSTDSQMPDPLREVPPADRYCDLVLNGGVASGVVYPWALLELARHFRFRSIGGNSVGAMAAALAAAAEYGRCNGYADAFEPLRRLPINLAEVVDPVRRRTKMLSLFQPAAALRRLFELFLLLTTRLEVGGRGAPKPGALRGLIWEALTLYGFSPVFVASLVVAVALAVIVGSAVQCGYLGPVALIALTVVALLGCVLLAAAVVLWRLWHDLGALDANGFGMCTGRGDGVQEGLVEWLHQGIQRSAGRTREEPPLTFADLWAAPRGGRPGPRPGPGGLQPEEPGVELQMFTSNVTQGRPVRLPLADANTRLYFDPAEWSAYFPPHLLDALVRASPQYRPCSASDPDPDLVTDPAQSDLLDRLRELPSGGMPIVVAARLSLCFPLLFSTVKVWAVDYEAPADQRALRPCLLSDGGLCTNFPIHLFDRAHPDWPTFGLLLDQRLEKFQDQSVWLPDLHLRGRADNWQRIVPGAENDGLAKRSLLVRLLGVAGGMLLTMKDWNDRVAGRLPHVRNRIVRMALKPGEGQLNIGMPRETILDMAANYGPAAAKKLLERFEPSAGGASEGWREHLYVRSQIELRALRRHLAGYGRSVSAAGDTIPLRTLFAMAVTDPPLASAPDRVDPTAGCLTGCQREALNEAVSAVEALEQTLAKLEDQFGPYRPVLEPELRLRPPV